MSIKGAFIVYESHLATGRLLPVCRAVQQGALAAGRSLAALRLKHHSRADPRYLDAFSQHFFTQVCGVVQTVATCVNLRMSALLCSISPSCCIQSDESLDSLPEAIELDSFDDLATAFLDQQLLAAIDTVDMQLKQEVRQVVLLGCGLDTRPFRSALLGLCMSMLCGHAAAAHVPLDSISAPQVTLSSVVTSAKCTVTHE